MKKHKIAVKFSGNSAKYYYYSYIDLEPNDIIVVPTKLSINIAIVTKNKVFHKLGKDIDILDIYCKLDFETEACEWN